MPTVAVVMATYNGARYVREQLASILNQGRLPEQIVVSDDHSSDDTIAIVREVLADFPGEVVVVSNPGERGVVANFSHALSFVSTELVALSDQDDLWHPDKLEAMTSAFAARSELTLLHTDARLVDAAGVVQHGTLLQTLSMSSAERRAEHEGRAFTVLLRRNFVTGATTLFRRTLLDSALPVPEGWLHDEWLAFVAAATGVVDFLELPLIDYRQHDGNEVGARLLSTFGKARRMSEPRADRNARLLLRAEQLPPRLEQLGADPHLIASVREKLSHEEMRSSLSANRPKRVIPITEALIRRRYQRYGRGVMDAIRDVLQTA